MNTKIRVQRICKYCGEEFTAKTSVTQFCSANGAKRGYKVKLRQAQIEKSNVETQAIRNKFVEELRAKDFLSITETCALLGLSARTVFRLLQNGRIPASKFDRRTIIKRADLEQLFA
jgi:excisionase family DNA binding protein